MTTAEQVAAEFESCGATPEGAHDQCVTESQRFVWALRERGIDAETVTGYHVADLMGFKVITQGHVGVRVGDVVYDWTARQFDPAAGFPHITTVAEWEAEWPSLEGVTL